MAKCRLTEAGQTGQWKRRWAVVVMLVLAHSAGLHDQARLLPAAR